MTQILSVAVPRPLDGLFTYLLPDKLSSQVKVGGWVKVPFGRKQTHAFIVEPPKSMSELPKNLAPEALKEILEVGPQGVVLPEDVLALCRWAGEYYHVPIGEMLNCAAPAAALGLKSAGKKERPIPKQESIDTSVVHHELTSEQKAALDLLEATRVSDAAVRVSLLHGVTGSGKTELYIELARRVLAEGKGVILLVPEIALSTQLHRRLEEGLGQTVALWHSAVADGKRRDLSSAIRNREIRVVVGARSAVFAPVPDLGLLIVDEEHDPTYKQEDRVRYHARDLAVVRSKVSRAFVVLGSATPSLETRQRVAEGRYSIAKLDSRVGISRLPSIEIVNLCEEEMQADTQAPLAKITIDVLRETLVAGEQAMVFLNRRGFASFLLCQDCGEVTGCPNCSISLTVHKGGRAMRLRCHVCGHVQDAPETCTKCRGDHLFAMGTGTESLEEEFPRLVQEAKVLRLDRDQVTSATRLKKILDSFRKGEANLLLGTQMVVKGHDFPNVTLVVVVMADALFRWPDFRSAERAYQILRQVAGRAGRGEKPGRVLIQTFATEHPVIQVMDGRTSERDFLELERDLRKLTGYPPFGRMARLRLESAKREEAQARSSAIAGAIFADSTLKSTQGFDLLGPSEAFLEKAKGIYRWDLLIKAPEVTSLQRAIRIGRDFSTGQDWSLLVDVDPYGTG